MSGISDSSTAIDFWSTWRLSYNVTNEAIKKFEDTLERHLPIPDGDIINIILLYFIKTCEANKIDKEILKTSIIEYLKIRPKTRRINLEKILEVLT